MQISKRKNLGQTGNGTGIMMVSTFMLRLVTTIRQRRTQPDSVCLQHSHVRENSTSGNVSTRHLWHISVGSCSKFGYRYRVAAGTPRVRILYLPLSSSFLSSVPAFSPSLYHGTTLRISWGKLEYDVPESGSWCPVLWHKYRMY